MDKVNDKLKHLEALALPILEKLTITEGGILQEYFLASDGWSRGFHKESQTIDDCIVLLEKFSQNEKEVTAPFTSVFPLEVVISDTIVDLLRALVQSDCF